MRAAHLDLPINQGSSFEMLIVIARPARLDITDYYFKGQIRPNTGSVLLTAQFNFEILDQTIDQTKGVVRVYLTPEQTRAIVIPRGMNGKRLDANFLYDIECGPDQDNVTRIVEGSVYIIPAVTR